jgi:hypothetical protein
VFNSSAASTGIHGAYLSLALSGYCTGNLQDVSLSGNIIEINENIDTNSPYDTHSLPIYATYLSLGINEDVQIKNLSVTNNKFIISYSLNNPSADLSAFHSSFPDSNIDNSTIENNTLQFNNVKDVTVKSIENFDTFVFNLPHILYENDTILTLHQQSTDFTVDANKLSISNYDSHPSLLNINLINSFSSGNISLINNESYLYNTRTALKVIDKTLIFTFDPSIAPSPVDPIDPAPNPDPDSPTPPIPDSVTLDPQTTVISQGAAANLACVFGGLDLIMDEGLLSAKNQAKAYSKPLEPFFSPKGLSPFAAFSASKTKLFSSNTNDIDLHAFSIIAGLAKDSSISNHNLTLALFFEHGNSKFQTSNFFNYDPTDDFTVVGKGNSFYNGGGFLARLDFVNNIYFDASFRLGNSSSDFFTSDLTKLSLFSYDYSTTYYGAHAGLGYLFNLNNNLGLDFSSKYFFTNLAGKDVSLPENQSVSFDTESMSKVKIGTKLQYSLSNDGQELNAYCGGGFEYEPSNKIEASINHRPVDTPELGGGRGLIEAGFNSSYKNFGIDLSAKYADGKAGNSMAGMLKFSYKI